MSGNDQVQVLYNRARLTLRDLTITRGRAFMVGDTSYCDTDPRARGGAINNMKGGTLELSNVTLSDGS